MPDYLSDLSSKDKPWDTHKKTADKVATLYGQVGYDKYQKRAAECARLLSFAHAVDDHGERKIKLHAGRFCRVRLCPVCQWRRSLMWRARFYEAMPKILADYPKARFLFLTLTVKNCRLDELREQIKVMNAAWHRMTNRKFFPAMGFVKSIEVTKGKDGGAHPHIHVLLMVKPSYFAQGYIKQADWTEYWRQALRIDYTPVVDIRVVKQKRSPKGKAPISITDALQETLKYSVKPQDLTDSPEWLEGLTKALHKTRGVSLGGLFKQYLSQDEPEDLINTEPESESKDLVLDEDPWIFEWLAYVKRYAKKN